MPPSTHSTAWRPLSLIMASTLLIALPVAAADGVDETSTDEDPASDEQAPDGEASTTELEAITVTGDAAAARRNILPYSDGLDSVTGTDRDYIDTPRQATIVSEELLDKAAISEIRDLTRVSASTYSPNNFGNTSLPTIRGDLGEIFQNGMRRIGGNNGFGFPTSFNSVEEINVVKGPPSVPLGPTQRVGGYINLVTKKPHLDAFRGHATVETGGFEGMSATDRERVRVDVGGPIERGVSGYRVSAEIIRDDEFHDFAETESEDLYVAFAHEPSDALRLDFSLEHFDTEFADVAGFNRATQDLIDNGTFITGTDPQAGPFPGLDAVADGENVISPTGTTELDRNQVLNHPDDFSEAEHTLAQLTVDWQPRDGFGVTNRTLIQDVSKTEVETNSFVEIIDTDRAFQNRTEFDLDFATRLGGLEWEHDLLTGVDVRYQEVVGFSQFTTEADNPIDLTGPLDSRRIPINDLSVQTADVQALRDQLVFLESEGVFVSPGAQYDVDGDGTGDFRLSDTTDSQAWQIGLFAQDDIRLAERWLLLAGVRADFYDVEARDPIPPAGVDRRASDSITEINPTANLSLTYKPGERSSVYFAYYFTKATSNSLGGGFALGPNNEIPDEDFDTDSELFEFGGRVALLRDELVLSSAIFEQTRSLRNRDGSLSGIKTQGAELEMQYQPNDRFYGTLNLSYLDVRFDDSIAFQGTRRVTDAFDDSAPEIIEGTGLGSPNVTAFGPTDAKVPGQPDYLLSAFANYRFTPAFSTHVGAVWTDEYKLDFEGTVEVPDQITVNAGAAYRWQDWEARLDVFNVTDEENFSPVFNGFFGGTLVFPEPPRSFVASLTYRF